MWPAITDLLLLIGVVCVLGYLLNASTKEPK